MKNKIILGSANFDQKYGIRKNSITKKENQADENGDTNPGFH